MSDILKKRKNLSYKDKIILYTFSLYFILCPLYLWKSGLPQVSDFVLIISMIIYAMTQKLHFFIHKENKLDLLFGILLVMWIIIVNSYWMLKLQIVDNFAISTLFYIYNFTVFTYVYILVNKYRIKIIHIVFKSALFSLLLQFTIYIYRGGFEGVRFTGFFNNPNQMGYYSLLMMSIIFFISKKIKIKTSKTLLTIIISSLLILASLSKAAILSLMGLLLFSIFSNQARKKSKRNLLIIIILCIVFGYIYNIHTFISDNQLLDSVYTRLKRIGKDNDDSLDARGYNRIKDYPEYWVTGAGEGDFTRYNFHYEFHSSLGNIQLSYGFIGLLLFLCFTILILQKDSFSSWYIIAIIFIYGLTHNGLRNSLFWILLALIATSNSAIRSSRKEKALVTHDIRRDS